MVQWLRAASNLRACTSSAMPHAQLAEALDLFVSDLPLSLRAARSCSESVDGMATKHSVCHVGGGRRSEGSCCLLDVDPVRRIRGWSTVQVQPLQRRRNRPLCCQARIRIIPHAYRVHVSGVLPMLVSCRPQT